MGGVRMRTGVTRREVSPAARIDLQHTAPRRIAGASSTLRPARAASTTALTLPRPSPHTPR